jgi:hypothetical protein
MIVRLLDKYINIDLVREVNFDKGNTVLMFDKNNSVSVPGDFRECLRQLTSGVVVTAANAAGFVS